MSIPSRSPALRVHRPKAPEPSPALIALQQKGLELPTQRTDSISPQSIPDPDEGLPVSPLSIVSTPSIFDLRLPVSEEERRPSSTGSAEIAEILRLYTNLSKASLRSEYEEITVDVDDSDEERLSCLTVHQPKAYRDTIAPLLEHQFSSQNLTVPPMPSPMSIASMPMLMHPDANSSVTSLHLTPEASPDLQSISNKKAALSQTSIQVTPDMSPTLPPTQFCSAPTFQEYSQNLRERKVALEVPDVRDAESWYDELLSPVSQDETEARSHESQLSAVSPETTDYQRQVTFEALVPPKQKISPNMRPVSYIQDDYLPGSTSATITQIVDSIMVPPPLDLARPRLTSKVSEGSTPVHQPEISKEDPEAEPRSQHASLITQDPIEGPMRGYLTPPPPDRFSNISATAKERKPLNIEEIYRPSSAFSDSSGSHHETFGGQLKAAWKGKFARKKEKKAKDSPSKTKKTKSGAAVVDAHVTTTSLTDDLESYKYPYRDSQASASTQDLDPPHRIVSPDLDNLQGSSQSVKARWSSAVAGPRSSVPHSPVLTNITDRSPRPDPRRHAPQAAIPLTEYQKYGPDYWYVENKRKKKEEKETRKAAKQRKKAPKANSNASNDFHTSSDHETREPNGHQRPDSSYVRAATPHTMSYSHSHTPSTSGSIDTPLPMSDTISVRSSTYTTSRKSGRTSVYNNDLFEASGGDKKKAGFASRVFMSSEEMRKRKVKESITIIGGQKMGGGGGDRNSEVSLRGLVKI